MNQEDDIKGGLIEKLKWLHRQWARYKATAARRALLFPNENSDVKVERYILGLSHELMYGRQEQFLISISPDTTFRPQWLSMNVPCPGMVIIRDIRVGSVSCTIGGSIDAYVYTHGGLEIDWPTLSPANKATLTGIYTGLVPSDQRLRAARRARTQYMAARCERLMQGLETLRTMKRLTPLKMRKIINEALVPPSLDPAGCAPSEKFLFNAVLHGPAGICA